MIVKLHDGREVDSYSEEWRLECEAKRVLRMSPLAVRQAELEMIERRRGPQTELRARMIAIHACAQTVHNARHGLQRELPKNRRGPEKRRPHVASTSACAIDAAGAVL